MIFSDEDVARVMRQNHCDRHTAIRHLKGRDMAIRALARRKAEAYAKVGSSFADEVTT